MTQDDDQGHRQEKRDSLFLNAEVAIDGDAPFSTRVRNLSAGGMMIDVTRDQVPGTPLVAVLRGIGAIAGRIAWSSPGRAGVAFNDEIDPRLARHSNTGKHGDLLPEFLKSPPGRRPGLVVR
jgi:hypothetical protein